MWQRKTDEKHLTLMLHSVQKQPVEVFYEKSFSKIFERLQENTFARVSFLIKLLEASNLIKKETQTQVFM